jgi:hypothetical protein
MMGGHAEELCLVTDRVRIGIDAKDRAPRTESIDIEVDVVVARHSREPRSPGGFGPLLGSPRSGPGVSTTGLSAREVIAVAPRTLEIEVDPLSVFETTVWSIQI